MSLQWQDFPDIVLVEAFTSSAARIKASLFSTKGLAVFVLIVTMLFLAAIWIITFALIDNERRVAVERSAVESENIASIVAASLDEVLGRALLYAQLGAPRATGERLSPPSSPLSPLAFGDRAYLRIAFFAPDGSLSYSSSKRTTEPELAAFTQRSLGGMASPEKDLILIEAQAVANQHAAWRVPLAVPQWEDGKLTGVMAAFIDLGYFLQLYKDVDIGSHSSIEIIHYNGAQIAELRNAMLSSGLQYPTADHGAMLASPEEKGAVGMLHPATGQMVTGVFRKLTRAPLLITVTREQSAILADLDSRHRNYLARAGLMSLGLVLSAAALAVLARRQRFLYTDLTRSEQQKQELIEQLQEEKDRAYALASQDYLTGLANRRMFHELASAELARAKRSRKAYALLFLDLDKFKAINDTLGHGIGDLLLQTVAERLRHSLRAYDLVARLGGDEFVILVSELESEEQVTRIASKLIEVISAPYPNLAGHDLEVGTSIGIALCPRDGHDIETLLSHADAAMYSAKHIGRGTYRYYDASLNISSARQLELASRFRRAITDGEFRLHFQARVELEHYRLVGLEALVRWAHPEHGLIYPGEFIPLAEESDVIIALGNWVIDAACRQIGAWRDAGLPVVPVAVNMSARQLNDPALAEQIIATLDRHAVPADLFEIEVTESAFVDNMDIAQSMLERLARHGVKVSLDDYGTGFSGLTYLKKLPITAVKIDRSFVRDIRNDTNDAMIVSSTISLAHNLKLQVVAEGVETKEQVVHLKTAGCDQVQGFYFQRPSAADTIEPLLRRGHFEIL